MAFFGTFFRDPMAFVETKDGKSGEDFPFNGKHGDPPMVIYQW